MADTSLSLRDNTPLSEQIKNCWNGCVKSCKENPARWGKLLSFYFGAYSLMTCFMSANMGGFIQSLPPTKTWENGNIWMGRPSHGNNLGLGEDGTVKNVLVMNRLSYGSLGKGFPYQKDDEHSYFTSNSDLVNKDGAEGYVNNEFTRTCGTDGACSAKTERMLISGHLNRLWSNHQLYSDFKVTCNNYYYSGSLNGDKVSMKIVSSYDGTTSCTAGSGTVTALYNSNQVCASVADCDNTGKRSGQTKTEANCGSDSKLIPTVEFVWSGSQTDPAFAPHVFEYLMEPTETTDTWTTGDTLTVKTVCAAHGNGCNLDSSSITSGATCKDEGIIAYSPIFGDKKRILKFDMKTNLKNQEEDDSTGNNEGLSDPTKLVWYTTWTIGA